MTNETDIYDEIEELYRSEGSEHVNNVNLKQDEVPKTPEPRNVVSPPLGNLLLNPMFQCDKNSVQNWTPEGPAMIGPKKLNSKEFVRIGELNEQKRIITAASGGDNHSVIVLDMRRFTNYVFLYFEIPIVDEFVIAAAFDLTYSCGITWHHIDTRKICWGPQTVLINDPKPTFISITGAHFISNPEIYHDNPTKIGKNVCDNDTTTVIFHDIGGAKCLIGNMFEYSYAGRNFEIVFTQPLLLNHLRLSMFSCCWGNVCVFVKEYIWSSRTTRMDQITIISGRNKFYLCVDLPLSYYIGFLVKSFNPISMVDVQAKIKSN